MRTILGNALIAVGVLISTGAHAATTTGSIAVTATVAASCAVANGATLAFGTVTGNASAVNATATLNVTCTTSTPYSYWADTGTHPSGGPRMQGTTTTTAYLPYTMYSDSGRTTVFPTATGTLSGTGNGSAQPILIYGQIASGITLPTPQAYTDTITFTVSY